MNAEPFVAGSVAAYRLFDIGYAIDLEHAARLLAEATPGAPPERVRPRRQEARALQIANPPLAVPLGMREVQVDGLRTTATLSARLFDFGVCAMKVEVDVPAGTPWARFGETARQVATAETEIVSATGHAIDALRARIAAAIERPAVAPVHEEYVVYRVTALHDADGRTLHTDALTDALLVPLLVGERRALAPSAQQELLQHRFAYYADDLVVLTWDSALVVEPRADDRDLEVILEFANAQLLELRVYDALLDAELPALYDRVEAARKRRLPTRRFSPVLTEVQRLVADVTETVERVEIAVKVTEDVYLARVYDAALSLFRADAWRQGIERKLGIFRDTYAMLNDEAQATRSEVIEVLVLIVIVAELYLGLIPH